MMGTQHWTIMFLVGTLCACSDDPVTGVRLTLDYQGSAVPRESVEELDIAVIDDTSSLEVDQPEVGNGRPAPETLELIFDDDTPFVNIAVAIRQGETNVAAKVDVPLVRGQLVEATLAFSNDCPVECMPDTQTQTCSPDERQVNACVALLNCAINVRSDLCAEGQRCVENGDVAACEDEGACVEGERQCRGGALQECQSGMFVELGEVIQCIEEGVLQFCEGDELRTGSARCTDDGFLETCDAGSLMRQLCNDEGCVDGSCTPFMCSGENPCPGPGLQCVDGSCAPIRCEGDAEIGSVRCGATGGREVCTDDGSWMPDPCPRDSACGENGLCCGWRDQEDLESVDSFQFRALVDSDGTFYRFTREQVPGDELELQIGGRPEPVMVGQTRANQELAIARLPGATELFYSGFPPDINGRRLLHVSVSDDGMTSPTSILEIPNPNAPGGTVRAAAVGDAVHVLRLDDIGSGRDELKHFVLAGEPGAKRLDNLGGELELRSAAILDVLVVEGTLYVAVDTANRFCVYEWNAGMSGWTDRLCFPRTSSASLSLAEIDGEVALAYLNNSETDSTSVFFRMLEGFEQEVATNVLQAAVSLASVRGIPMVSYVVSVASGQNQVRVACAAPTWNTCFDSDFDGETNVLFSPSLESGGSRAYLWWSSDSPNRAAYTCE